jgi:hypothetical protein
MRFLASEAMAQPDAQGFTLRDESERTACAAAQSFPNYRHHGRTTRDPEEMVRKACLREIVRLSGSETRARRASISADTDMG